MKLILLGLFLLPALLPLYASADYDRNENFYVCESTECQARAKLINESLNTSVDPCEDFYSYACAIFENMTIATADQSPAEKAGVFFKACSGT
ncbi:hypothetical protein V5799_027985 [Amblyomma americanum]|uniref:M13 family peptidase n=1 Tax=Amblyomma americanum TaxID=6943 RepID=A0AAQ4DE58_AMBAM